MDLLSTYLYRAEEFLTLNEIPMLLLQIREKIECEQLLFLVSFPYIIRRNNHQLVKCDCIFQFKDTRSGGEFQITMKFKMHGCVITERSQQLEVCLTIQSENFVWIEDVYQIFVNICDLSFSSLDDLSLHCMSYFTVTNDLPSIDTPQIIQCQSLELAITSHIDFQKSYTIKRSLQKSAQQSKQSFYSSQKKKQGDFGFWLRKQRKTRNIKQLQLSKVLHVSNSFISKIESGEKQPSKDLVDKIARLWNISVEQLYIKAQIFDSHAKLISQHPDQFLKWIYDIRKQNP